MEIFFNTQKFLEILQNFRKLKFKNNISFSPFNRNTFDILFFKKCEHSFFGSIFKFPSSHEENLRNCIFIWQVSFHLFLLIIRHSNAKTWEENFQAIYIKWTSKIFEFSTLKIDKKISNALLIIKLWIWKIILKVTFEWY